MFRNSAPRTQKKPYEVRSLGRNAARCRFSPPTTCQTKQNVLEVRTKDLQRGGQSCFLRSNLHEVRTEEGICSLSPHLCDGINDKWWHFPKGRGADFGNNACLQLLVGNGGRHEVQSLALCRGQRAAVVVVLPRAAARNRSVSASTISGVLRRETRTCRRLGACSKARLPMAAKV